MKLALGTVQFGLNYGVSNVTGKVSQTEATALLSYARETGIDTLDTAAAYGDSETVLGLLNVDGFRVMSKLPLQISENTSVGKWVENSVRESLLRLRQDTLYGLLLHRPSQLSGFSGDALYDSLLRLKCRGLISKIGVSIYDPTELDGLLKNFDLDLVQAPFSVVDRRLITSGWMGRLAARGIEVHVRSIFLQGLLLLTKRDRPHRFDQWESLWRRWHGWLEESKTNAVDACVRYALSHPGIAKVIVGVESRNQLQEIVTAVSKGPIEVPKSLMSDSKALLNPAVWANLN